MSERKGSDTAKLEMPEASVAAATPELSPVLTLAILRYQPAWTLRYGQH
jgi:hypothetical protein